MFFIMTALSKKVMKEMGKMHERQTGFNQQQQQKQQQQKENSAQEPTKGKTGKSLGDDHGEYVDFEEIKD